MKIVQKKIETLVHPDYNPRRISDKDFEHLKKSLTKFTAVEPAVINTFKGRENIIVGGNQRVRAAKAMGWDDFPCVEVSLNAGDEAELNVRLNRNTGEFDFEKLADEFNFEELLDWGFDKDELDIFGDGEESTSGLTEDEVPEVPEDPKTKPGDLWTLGEHQLHCGDSTNIQHVEKLMGGEKADMVFTDPPYNIDYGNIKHPKFKQRSIENDNMTGAEFKEFCTAFVSCIKLTCDGCVYVFGHPGPDGRTMFVALDTAMHCSTTIVWNKDQFTLGRGKYQNKYEPCWFGWNNSGSSFTNDRKLTNVWDFPRPKSSKLHPTMKPVELIENAIGHASNSGGKVLDLFGGSGSTIIACEKTNRKCRMMELDAKYCDVILSRWSEYTGKDPVLDGGVKWSELNK